MQEDLQEELAKELGRYGIDAAAEGLTDDQYTTAMEELARRRQELLALKEPEEQRRVIAMRNTMLWHLHNVGSLQLDLVYCCMLRAQQSCLAEPCHLQHHAVVLAQC